MDRLTAMLPVAALLLASSALAQPDGGASGDPVDASVSGPVRTVDGSVSGPVSTVDASVSRVSTTATAARSSPPRSGKRVPVRAPFGPSTPLKAERRPNRDAGPSIDARAPESVDGGVASPRPPIRNRRPGRSRRRFRRTAPKTSMASPPSGLPDASVSLDAGLTADAGVAAGSATRAPPARPTVEGPSRELRRGWGMLQEVVSIFGLSGGLRSLLNPLLLVGVLAVSLLLSATAARVRPRLAARGLLPRLVSFVHMAGRFLALAIAAILIVEAAPASLQPALPWVLLAAAAAVGWSARDLLPDLLASGVLLGERRVRRGVHVSGRGFSGSVERLGLRATWLRDDLGRPIAIPNRRLLTGPVVLADESAALHRTSVWLSGHDTVSPIVVRQALAKAVATSPWVPLGVTPELSQDSRSPEQWHVTVRLRRRSDAPRFDGHLRGRAEAMLTAEIQRTSNGLI